MPLIIGQPARRPYTLHVSAGKGRRHQREHCPVANVIKQTLDTSFANVTGNTVSYLHPETGRIRRARLPPPAVRWIQQYDAGDKPSPLSLTLSL